MVRCFPKIFQNEKLRSRLADEISGNHFPHAYIIAGKPGSGKKTLALEIAAALACKSKDVIPCGKCDSCEKIIGGYSPDVIFIRKDSEKKEFTINLIREIKDSLYIAPNELEKRVYILEDAETMNANAQNAFLKMLEEPPSYVVFLLICSDTESLLETIKSRAPILYTEQISPDGIIEFLLENSAKARELNETSPEKLRAIAVSAEGSIGYALNMCEKGADKEALKNTVTDFLDCWTAPSMTELDLFCDSLPSSSDAMEEFLATLKKALRDIAVYKHDGECDLLFFDSTEKIDCYASKVTTKKALRLINAADALSEKLKFYLDMRLAAVTFCADARRINTK